jgi:hypothetical protein
MKDAMTWDGEYAYGWSSQHENDSNRLKWIEHHKLTVSLEEVDIWFRVAVEKTTPGTEVRGRIVGPRSLFSETVKVVSPLRSVKHKEEGQPALIARTAFPNPRFWDPHAPFLYRVVVELWQDGHRCDVSAFDLGFRSVEMGSSNIFVNKQPVSLQGVPYLPQSREDADDRRKAGYNLVVAEKGQWHWWIKANPMGFLLLEKVALSTLTPQYFGLLCQQPCFFGFVLDKELLMRAASENESFLRPWQERGVFIGLETDEPPSRSLPNGLSFLVCPESMLPALNKTALPKLVIRELRDGMKEQRGQAIPGVLGWIDPENRNGDMQGLAGNVTDS